MREQRTAARRLPFQRAAKRAERANDLAGRPEDWLLIDDFWGQRQWDAFYRDFSLLFPDRELVELTSGHEIYRTFYDIEGAQMIPGRGGRQGFGQAGIDVASNHAILDDQGRVMVLINWNSDMGDGWETRRRRPAETVRGLSGPTDSARTLT